MKNYWVVWDVWAALLMVEYAAVLVGEGWLKKMCHLLKGHLWPRGKRGDWSCAQVPRGPIYCIMVFPHTQRVIASAFLISLWFPGLWWVVEKDSQVTLGVLIRKHSSMKPWGRKEKTWQSTTSKEAVKFISAQPVACPANESWWHPCLCGKMLVVNGLEVWNFAAEHLEIGV